MWEGGGGFCSEFQFNSVNLTYISRAREKKLYCILSFQLHSPVTLYTCCDTSYSMLLCIFLSMFVLSSVSTYPVTWDMPPLRNLSMPAAIQKLLDDTRKVSVSSEEVIPAGWTAYLSSIWFGNHSENGNETWKTDPAPLWTATSDLPTESYLANFLESFFESSTCSESGSASATAEEFFTSTTTPLVYSTGFSGSPGPSSGANGTQISLRDSSAFTLALLSTPPFTLLVCVLSLGKLTCLILWGTHQTWGFSHGCVLTYIIFTYVAVTKGFLFPGHHFTVLSYPNGVQICMKFIS